MKLTDEKENKATCNISANQWDLATRAASETGLPIKFIDALDVHGRPVKNYIGLELQPKTEYGPFWKRLNELRKENGLDSFE